MAFLEKHLGPNWAVRLFGYITLAMVAIVADPSLISFLPDAWEPAILELAKFVAVVTGGLTVHKVKDANVTGGKVAATNEAAVRVQEEKKLEGAKVQEEIFPAEVVSEEEFDRIPRSIVSLKDE